jgi:hypothetical protein
LTPSTTYEWQIRSACSAGNSSVSAWSSTQTLTTLTPCVKPTNLAITAVSLTDASFSWDAVAGAWGYIVRYKQTSPVSTSWAYDTVTTNSYLLAGLSSGGTYRLWVRTMCDSTGNSISSFTKKVIFSTLSGNRNTIESVDIGINLNIYPNPTRGLFNVSFISQEINNFEITIVDGFGRMISHENEREFIGEYTKKVDLSNWPRGVYMLQIKTKDSYVSKRIVLQ